MSVARTPYAAGTAVPKYDSLSGTGAETVQGSGMSWEIHAPGFVSTSAAFENFCNTLAGAATVQGSGMSWEILAPGGAGDVSAAFAAYCNGGWPAAEEAQCLAAPDWGTFCSGLPPGGQVTACFADLSAAQAAVGAGTNAKKVILVVHVANSQGVLVPDTFVTYVADPTP